MGNKPTKGKGHVLGKPPPEPQRQASNRTAAPAPAPARNPRNFGGGMSMSQAAAAGRAPAPAHKKRAQAAQLIERTSSEEQQWQRVQAGLQRMAAVGGPAEQAALVMLDKLLSNILKHPDQAKFRTIWLSNAKVGKCLKSADGAVLLLEGSGFEPGAEPETMVYDKTKDPSNNFLYRSHDAIKSQLYALVGRPNVSGELGSTAAVGKMVVSSAGQIGDDRRLADKMAASGGICAQKYSALETEEFTIEQCQRLQDSFEYLCQSNPVVVCERLLMQLKPALEEILREPELLSLRNLPVPPELGEIEGARNLAETLGLEFVELEEEPTLICSLTVPILRSVLDQMCSFLDALTRLQEAEAAASTVPRSPAPVPDRDLRILRFNTASSAGILSVPESFFELTRADMVQMQQASGKVHAVKVRRYNRCMVRIQLPSEVTIQAVFGPTEKVGALYELVAGMLAEPFRAFALGLGSQELEDRTRSLWDSGLVPSALLHFRWLPMEGMEPCSMVLTEELMQTVVAIN
eukprot:TRINITY_DN9244_c0_g3_i3.p1 TRINITY_DN9244_c0_g3~~TRINITY_DN9244_c0_g3_i3.p1  ORF type:complete len:520 (+),score=136.64 TRINITY_DN9244_c0_g3_i3:192-1751(+)